VISSEQLHSKVVQSRPGSQDRAEQEDEKVEGLKRNTKRRNSRSHPV